VNLPNTITDNSAAFIGFLRAALILVAAFWPKLFTTDQTNAIIALAVASLALSAVTIRTTVPATPSNPTAGIQVPPPVV
jgi:hypothetical protein